MTENELRVGEPRLCHLIDGNPDTPEAVVMLQNTGNAIEATFPLSGMAGIDGPYDRWWSHNVMYGDDPDRTRHSDSPPPVLLLYDNVGPVALVGCRAGRSQRSLHAGIGTILADFAILGAEHLKYSRINGMTSASSAYSKWWGGSSIRTSPDIDESGRLQSLTLNLEKTNSVRISRKLNMSTRWHWRSTPVTDGYDLRESLTFSTRVRNPRGWAEHLELHISILDLISIAAWRNCSFQEVQVFREDDPVRTIDGKAHGERWLKVISHRFPGNDLSDCQGRFLFTYRNMHRGAIDQWLRLREVYHRPIDYLMRILRSGNTWSPLSAVTSGIALEQLGYVIEVEKNDKKNLNKRGQLAFIKALEAILEDMEVLPFKVEETDDWKERCRNVYMGAKHGDRNQADQLTTLNTLRENLLVLRYWIAQKLGVDGETLKQNLTWDPLGNRFVAEEVSI